MPATTMEQYVTSLIERRVPYNGPVESEVWNDTIEEMVRDIVEMQRLWNSLLYPLLGTMPSGPVEITALDRTADISPIDNGLDGSQLFMDMTATSTDESYYSDILGRAYTIKEVFEVFREDTDEAIEEAKEAAVMAGLTEDAKEKIGARIFYTGRTSAPDSLDGLTQRLDLLVDQLVADVFNEGYDTGAPPDYSTYPLSSGLQSRDHSIREQLDALQEIHGGVMIGNSHIFIDPFLEGTTDPQVIQAMVKTSDAVDDNYDSGTWPGTPQHLEHEVNQLRTAVRRLAGWMASDFDSSVPVWTTLPDDGWAGNPNKLSLKGHVERKGHGTIAEFNPHGLSIEDIDNLQDLIDLGLIIINSEDVVYNPTGGAGSILGGLIGSDVRTALEALEDGIETNIADIVTNAAGIAANVIDIATNVADIVILDGRLDTIEPEWATHKVRMNGLNHEADHIWLNAGWKAGIARFVSDTHVQDALTTIDTDITGFEANLLALREEYDSHIDPYNQALAGYPGARHMGTEVDFSSTTTEPLEYPIDPAPPEGPYGDIDSVTPVEGDPIINVGHAINELAQLNIDDRISQDTQIAAAAQESVRYVATNISTLYPHGYQIFVDPTGDDILGDGTEAAPYATINRAMSDVGHLVVPKIDILIKAGTYPESIFLDQRVLERGKVFIQGYSGDPNDVVITGGPFVSKRVYFFGAGLSDMEPAGTYVPPTIHTRTSFYVQISKLGDVDDITFEVVADSVNTGTLAQIPDDDWPVVFSNTGLNEFLTEVTYIDGATELTAGGEYSINYATGDWYLEGTGDSGVSGTVDYRSVNWSDSFKWWYDNELPPEDYDDWDNTTAYIIGDKVYHEGVRYNCTTGHTGQEPPGANWAVFVHPRATVITEKVPQSLAFGATIEFVTNYGHNLDDVFFFNCYPQGEAVVTARNTSQARLLGVTIDSSQNYGVVIEGNSHFFMSNIVVKNAASHGILGKAGAQLKLDTYHVHRCGGNGVHMERNSHANISGFDSTLDTLIGHSNVTGWGGYAEWHSGIATCAAVPTGVSGTLGEDSDTYGRAKADCFTTTTTTVTTTSSTSTTASTASTASTVSSTSTTTTYPPVMFLVGDGAGAGPPPAIGAPPWTSGAFPPGPPGTNWTLLGDNIFGPPVAYPGLPHDGTEMSNSGTPGPGPTGGPASEDFVLGTVAIPGSYTDMILHIRMVTFVPPDSLDIHIFDNTGALMGSFLGVVNVSLVGTYETITVPGLTGGPIPSFLDTLVNGGTMRIDYLPTGADAGINISDVRLDFI